MSELRTFLVTVEAAQTGVPDWASGLSSYQVRNLTGATFGPTNNKPCIADPTEGGSIQGVIPAVWNYRSQSWGRSTITSGWAGGRGDLAGRRLFVHGGGHGDCANNGFYVYEFGTGNRPTGWRLAGTTYPSANCSLSTIDTPGLYVAGNWGSGSDTVYVDNKPSSIHGYDQAWFNSAQQRYYRFGGAPFRSGYSPTVVYYYDLIQDRWSTLLNGGQAWANIPGPTLGGSLAATVFASPDESKMLFVGNGNTTMRMFSSADASFNDRGASPFGSNEQYVTGVCVDNGNRDATNDRWITIDGRNGTARILDWTINWNTNAISWVARSHASHATHLRTILNGSGQFCPSSAGSIVYDAAKVGGPCLWVFGTVRHMVGAIMEKEILHVNMTTWEVTPYALSGDNVLSAQWGSNSRHLWFPSYRVIATVQDTASPVAIIKVPN